jgi:mRNA-degrading endonuclease RelE of RelBE toxin-antitoxin system
LSKYQVRVEEGALKNLAKVDRKRRKKLWEVIEKLADDPFPPRSKSLQADPSRRVIRFSAYRIIYEVIADTLIIHVWDVDNRKDVYKKYDRR